MSRTRSNLTGASISKSRAGSVASRQLKREIGRRATVQAALTASERRYEELLEKSRRMQSHLRRLSHVILSAQEEERKTISRELHDQIGQTLIAINVKLALLHKHATVNLSGLKTTLAGTQRLLDQSLGVVHRFARELRPPLLDDLGLIPALHSFVTDFTKRTHIAIHVTAFASVEQLASDKRLALYRVAQEALTNVAKHAKATAVKVRLTKLQGVVRMDIHDNGKSFRVERALMPKQLTRLGLVGMRERIEMVGGSFHVDSAPGRGTTIRADIPLRKPRR